MKLPKSLQTFDDKIREFLIHYPGLYAILAAVSIILFWEGVSDVAKGYPILTGPVLIIISTPVLLILGVFLPFFVNDRKLLSALNHEEVKIEHEIEHEEKKEEKMLAAISEKIKEMDTEIHEIRDEIHTQK